MKTSQYQSIELVQNLFDFCALRGIKMQNIVRRHSISYFIPIPELIKAGMEKLTMPITFITVKL